MMQLRAKHGAAACFYYFRTFHPYRISRTSEERRERSVEPKAKL